MLQKTDRTGFTVGRFIEFNEGQPELWVWYDRDMSLEDARRMRDRRNKEMSEMDFVSPESPFFVIMVTTTRTLERADD